MEHIVETSGLNFSFGRRANKKQILYDVSLQVPRGSIYCFLGPNGAGKTTTLRMILALITSNNHNIFLFGKDLLAHRVEILRRVGSIIEQPSLYHHLTGRQNLEIFRLSYGVKKNRISEVLELTGISYAANQVVRTYSLGMKQRLAIALSLLNDPDLLILDEPTNGLDPEGIIEMRDLLAQLNQEYGKTILISSHLLSEVEKIGTHFGILSKGHLLFQGSGSDMRSLVTDHQGVELEVDDATRAEQLLSESINTKKVSDHHLLFPSLQKESIPSLIRQLVEKDIRVYKVNQKDTTLEDLFIKIISQ